MGSKKDELSPVSQKRLFRLVYLKGKILSVSKLKLCLQSLKSNFVIPRPTRVQHTSHVQSNFSQSYMTNMIGRLQRFQDLLSFVNGICMILLSLIVVLQGPVL